MIPLVMSIIAKTETFQRDMAKARGHVGQFESSVKRSQLTMTAFSMSILRLAGVGGGLYALQRGLRASIGEASRAEETFAKFNVVFKDQAEAARQWAEDYGNSVGRATHIVADWAAGLQDTFVPLGIARDEAAKLSEGLVELAVDVASFNNKMDADVIRDFTSALVGNHETVRKYGIIISESALKQEALRQGLNKTYKELTDLEKVQLRYSLIQQGTTDAQGDAIRTGDSYANQVKRLKNNIAELEVALGQELLPVLTDLVKQMNEFVQDGDRIANSIGRIADATKTYWKYYSAFMSRTPGGKILGKLYGGLAAPRAETYMKPEFAGAMPANETENLNKRLEEAYKSNREEAEDNSKEVIHTTMDIAQAYVRMYDEINSKSKESYEWQKKLINEEYNLYEKKVKDKILLEELRQERLRQLAIEQAKATGGFVEGFGAGIAEMQDKMQTIGELGAEVAETFRDGMVDGLNEALWKAQDLEDAMKELGITIAKMVTQWLLMQAVTNTMSAIGLGGGAGSAAAMATAITTAGGTAATAMGTGISTAGGIASNSMFVAITTAGEIAAAAIAAATVAKGVGGAAGGAAHSGGVVGHTGFRLRAVPASTFAGAPRLHKGLMRDEYPAILQTGEQVIPRGAAKNNGLENKLDTLISIMSERQTINANIIDRRDVITRERIESREGEQWTMKHIQRNS